MPFALTPERDRELSDILTRYPTKMAACIPVLHLCQDQLGWVSDEVIDFVARRLDLPPAHVKGVVTFYTLFNQKPVGKHQVWVCRTLPCALRGAGNVLEHCEKKLGIKPGETTPDGKVTLRTAECLASCGTAPMMQVDKAYFENLTLERVDQILDRLIAGQPVSPTTTSLPRPAAPSGRSIPVAAPVAGAGSLPPVSPPPPRPPMATLPGTGGTIPPVPRPPGPTVSSRPPGPGSATPPPPPRTPSARPPAAPSNAGANTADAIAPSAEKTSSTAPPKRDENKSET